VIVRRTLVMGLGLLMTANGAASEDKPAKKYTETLKTKEGTTFSFDMVILPGGTFMMGIAADQAGRADHEGPQHTVQLDPFYLCTTETLWSEGFIPFLCPPNPMGLGW
jgi:formylglycine-generating enzyme required for sulfatase activity